MLSKLYSIFGRRPPKRTLISELGIGEFRCIEGDAIAIGEPLIAPFSGTKCATLSVSNRYPLPGGPRREVTRWSRESQFVFRPRFYVRDESGLVRVARCKRTNVFAYAFPTMKVASDTRVASLEAFRASFREEDEVLAGFNRRMRSMPFRKMRWHEIVIAHGSRIRIEGLVRNSGEPLPVAAAVGFREAPTLLELVAPRRKAMRITRIKRPAESLPSMECRDRGE